MKLLAPVRTFGIYIGVLALLQGPTAADVKDLFGEDLYYDIIAGVERQKFIQQVGGLGTPPECRFNPVFWEDVYNSQGKHLRLGLYHVDRWVSSAGAYVTADVLSLLVRRGGEDAIWLRVESRETAGWVRGDTGADVSHLFWSCFAEIHPAEPSFWVDPCQGRVNCESQVFLLGDSVGTLRPARRVLEQEPLGKQGMARWRLIEAARETQKSGEQGKAFEARLAASLPIWKSTIWRSNRLDPDSEQIFFPQTRRVEEDSEGAAPARIDRIPGLTRLPRTASKNTCTKIFAPRANAEGGDWGFAWDWRGLPGARAIDFKLDTDGNGCLDLGAATDQSFDILLQNDHLAVYKLQEPAAPVFVKLNRSGPYSFINPGGDIMEVLVATNAFASANEGLEGFGLIDSWLPGLVRNLKIYQSQSPNTGCSAQRFVGRIYLPYVCPGHDGFVPKGLCGDVVVHELAHEVMGALVRLATAGRESTVKDATINEALASFFALLIRPKDRGLYYAPACQNDFFEIKQGGKKLNTKSLLSALLFAPNQKVPVEDFARVVVLATFYGHSSVDAFREAFFDFAVDKAQLDADLLRPICEAFYGNAGICDHRCPVDFSCVQADRIKLGKDHAEIFGTFLATQACPSYRIIRESHDKGNSASIKVAEQSGRKDLLLGRFKIPPSLTTPFDVVLKSKCAASVAEVQRLSFPGLPDRILEGGTESVPISAVAAGPAGFRQLIVSYGDGMLRQVRVDGSGSVSLGETIWPGFSVTNSGSLQGWTTESRQFTLLYAPDQGDWEKRSPSVEAQSAIDRAPRAVESKWIGDPLQYNPRIEILGIDTFKLTLAVWPEQGDPTVRSFSFGRQVDPTSLEIGIGRRGSVLEVKGLRPETSRTYAWKDGDLQESSDLAVFPVETPGLSFRRAGKEIAFKVLRGVSACNAPPDVVYFEHRWFVLTCDGVLAVYVESDEQNISTELAPVQLGGILVPSVGARPIQLGDIDGVGEPDLIIGPLRQVIKGLPEDRVEIRSLKGEIITSLRSIRSSREIKGAPVVINVDDDCCDEVITVTEQLEVWDANKGIQECRCQLPN